MITLGGVLINDNMYLEGLETAPMVVYEQKRTLDGESDLRISPLIGGRTLTLGTQNRDGANQGIWCMGTIHQIQAMQGTGIDLILNYRGDVYNVRVVSTESLTPLHQFEPESDTKKFVGKITLIEV